MNGIGKTNKRPIKSDRKYFYLFPFIRIFSRQFNQYRREWRCPANAQINAYRRL
jgi:hypothetical protein